MQWVTSLAIVVAPFVRFGDRALVGVDVPGHRIHLLFAAIALEQMIVVLLAAVAGLLLFLLVTVLLGRVWCGWACPQTVLSDLVEWAGRRLKLFRKKPAGAVRVTMFHGVVLLLSAGVGANLVMYVVPPADLLRAVVGWHLGPVAAGTWLTLTALLYVNLAFVRRRLCASVCPYGRFQAALASEETLTLALLPARADLCIDCGACVAPCPTGIDIRDGEQVECITCGRCLDACGKVMGARGEAGLIGYVFGRPEQPRPFRLTPRLLLLGVGALLAAGAAAGIAATWSPLDLTVRRTSASARTTSSGEAVIVFQAVAVNRGRDAVAARLEARSDDGQRLSLRGQTEGIDLAAGERRRLTVVLTLPPHLAGEVDVRFFLSAGDDRVETGLRLATPKSTTISGS